MKSYLNIFVKFSFLVIILSIIAPSLDAKNTRFQKIKSNKIIHKQKVNIKTNNITLIRQLYLEELELVEETKEIEEWMLDNKFWEIIKETECNQKPAKETSIVEEWIFIFNNQKEECLNAYSDFLEEEWMHEHTFLIL